jgi:zinc/manganese transport system permease protein
VTAFEISIIVPALLAMLLVLSTHVPLGTEVLRRGIIFIDLAIAQVAGLGVIAADSMGWEAQGWMVQIAAVSAALIAAFILHWTDRRWPEVQEALIGVSFILAATAGILLLAGNPHGGEHLKELLVGQVLWVTYEQLLPVAAVSALVLFAWYWFRDHLQGFGFYALFSGARDADNPAAGPAYFQRLRSRHSRQPGRAFPLSIRGPSGRRRCGLGPRTVRAVVRVAVEETAAARVKTDAGFSRRRPRR